MCISLLCLGYDVGEDGVSTDSDKVAAIVNFPKPRNAAEVRSVLGLAGFYRGFVGNLSAMSQPLNDLTKRGTAFRWSPACDDAFHAIKTALASAPVLAQPRWDQPFILRTDWSRIAVGAVRSQVDPDTGAEHPIAFASRGLTPAERNYAATEGECLALVWAVHKFRPYLHGHYFKAY